LIAKKATSAPEIRAEVASNPTSIINEAIVSASNGLINDTVLMFTKGSGSKVWFFS